MRGNYKSSEDYPEYRINAHGHLLPYPEQIPDFMKEEEVLWISDDRKFMHQKDWKRPITDPSFFLEEKVMWMQKNNIDHEVVLNLSQLYCNGMKKDLAVRVCAFQNNFNYSTQSAYPEMFTSGFVLPIAYPREAIRELRRCVDEMKMNLLCLPTHYMTPEGKWKSVASDEQAHLWEAVDDLGIAVQVHPYDGQKIIDLEDTYWRFHLVWMCAQTADTYHLYTLMDYPQRYPNLRVCFAHGNQFGQINVGRRRQGYLGRPDLFTDVVDPKKNIGHKSIFFDTLVHDTISLNLLKTRQGVTQIIAGLDDPYPLGEMGDVGDSYPGKTLDDAVAEGYLSAEERRMVWYDNVINWLYGEDQSAFKERVHRNNKQREAVQPSKS